MVDPSGGFRVTLAFCILILSVWGANNLGTVKIKYKKAYLNTAGIEMINGTDKTLFQYVIEQDQNEARRRCSAHCSNLNFGSSACNVIWIKEETLGTVYQCTLVSLDSLNDLDGMVVKKTDPGSTEVLLLNLVDALHNEIVE